jgi:hypothetical protein
MNNQLAKASTDGAFKLLVLIALVVWLSSGKKSQLGYSLDPITPRR